MSWVATAIAGSAVLGAYSSNRASAAQQDAANSANDVQRYMYDTTRNDYAPYRNVGSGALNMLAQLYGVPTSPNQGFDAQEYLRMYPDVAADKFYGSNPYQHYMDYGQFEGRQKPTVYSETSGSPDMSMFYTSPGYQFRMDEGIQALDRSAASRGRLNSGANTKAVMNYAQGLASNEFGNYVNQLNNLAGIGQTATNSTSNAGQNYATGAANSMMNAGDARASGYLGLANTANNAINNYSLYNALNSGGGYPTGYTDLMSSSGYGNMF